MYLTSLMYLKMKICIRFLVNWRFKLSFVHQPLCTESRLDIVKVYVTFLLVTSEVAVSFASHPLWSVSD